MNKNNNYFEIIVGTLVILTAGVFLATSMHNSKMDNKGKKYYLLAKFNNISGLGAGSDIKISGVKIGTVSEDFLDKKTYQATLKLAIDEDVKLPTDSSAKISSEGLLGSKYLSIEVGSAEEFLSNNEEIQFTQSSVNFEDLLGKFIFNSGNKDENKDDKKPQNEL